MRPRSEACLLIVRLSSREKAGIVEVAGPLTDLRLGYSLAPRHADEEGPAPPTFVRGSMAGAEYNKLG